MFLFLDSMVFLRLKERTTAFMLTGLLLMVLVRRTAIFLIEQMAEQLQYIPMENLQLTVILNLRNTK
jgi:hypothetical protein